MGCWKAKIIKIQESILITRHTYFDLSGMKKHFYHNNLQNCTKSSPSEQQGATSSALVGVTNQSLSRAVAWRGRQWLETHGHTSLKHLTLKSAGRDFSLLSSEISVGKKPCVIPFLLSCKAEAISYVWRQSNHCTWKIVFQK